MGYLWCRDGEHKVKVAFQPKPGERFCPEHPEAHLGPLPQERKAMSRGVKKRGTAAYDKARRLFNNVVGSKRCFFSDWTEAGDPRRSGHKCRYPLDSHHLVGKEWISRFFSDLPEDEFLWILFRPAIGAPLCRPGHESVERHSDYVYWEEISEECVEFCEWVDEKYGDRPLPDGTKRPSMLERLKLESPSRSTTGREAA